MRIYTKGETPAGIMYVLDDEGNLHESGDSEFPEEYSVEQLKECEHCGGLFDPDVEESREAHEKDEDGERPCTEDAS